MPPHSIQTRLGGRTKYWSGVVAAIVMLPRLHRSTTRKSLLDTLQQTLEMVYQNVALARPFRS